ncbi:MAG: sigma-70 family RNA polymerase sigma factor [Rubripirellula sp.]
MAETNERNENDRRSEFTQHWLSAEPSVSAYVFAVVAGFHDAEDLVQQIAQEAARRFDQYDVTRPFLGWVLWIAKSRVIDFYRKRDADPLLFSDGLLERLGETIAERKSACTERREALERCLEGLPEKSRQLLDLRYVKGLPSFRIAETVGSTHGSVRVLLTRVRNRLADCVERRLAMESES